MLTLANDFVIFEMYYWSVMQTILYTGECN